MRRSKRRRIKAVKSDKERIFLLFLTGIALGLLVFLWYKFYVVSRTPKLAPAVPSPSPLPIGERGQAKVAIVLDDFGYNYKNVEAVFNLKRPVTFAILPHHPYSKTISIRAHEKGYEGILHLPLQPHEREKHIRPELNTITVGMDKAAVLNKLANALIEVPYATGVSNHQGSKATEDIKIMRIIFEELKRRNLYFLDSLSTNGSVCKNAARDVGIRFGRRSVFLDNSEDFEYIRGQMQQLIRKAKRSGAAVGIGHDREKTVAALAVLLPEAEKEGIEFVYLSELIK